jgi:hypothetical protein
MRMRGFKAFVRRSDQSTRGTTERKDYTYNRTR